jgi:hypothetical protein
MIFHPNSGLTCKNGETPETRRIPLQGSAFLLAFGDFFEELANLL